MEYRSEDVKGYRVDGELVCINCVTAEDDEGLQRDEYHPLEPHK